MSSKQNQLHAIEAAFKNQVSGLVYQRLEDTFDQLIKEEQLEPGSKLPGERDLSTLLGISRSSIRKAFASLSQANKIEARKGAGHFVRRAVDQHLTSVSGFTEDFQARQLQFTNKILEQGTRPLRPQDAMSFGQPLGTMAFYLKRLRYVENEAVAIETAFVLPETLVELQVAENSSLYQQMDATGNRPVHAIQRLRAGLASKEDAELLGIEQKSAVLYINRKGMSKKGRIVEITRSVYRGDRYDFHVELGERPE